MGLDQYLIGRKKLYQRYEHTIKTDEGFPVSAIEVELCYWRKHQALHDYITTRFNNADDDCVPLILGKDDLELILKDLDDPLITGCSTSQAIAYSSTFKNALAWLTKITVSTSTTAPKTTLGQTLGALGLNVHEMGFDPQPIEMRSITYEASW